VIVTISTVGYGDKYPVTNAGRILGSIIIVIGVGIFGTFTGYLATTFLSSKEQPSEARPGDAQRQIDRLKELLAQQQAAVDQVEVLLQADGH
jgi:voltage-gated potassium channel